MDDKNGDYVIALEVVLDVDVWERGFMAIGVKDVGQGAEEAEQHLEKREKEICARLYLTEEDDQDLLVHGSFDGAALGLCAHGV